MKYLISLSLIVFLTACSHERSNRQLTSYGDSAPDWEGAEAEAHQKEMAVLEQREKAAEVAKKNHGLMHIHRYGPGYDVMMSLDAGDSDVSFTMKLPKENPDFKDQAEKLRDEFRQRQNDEMEMLDEEKGELHDEELAKRNELMAEQKRDSFHESTKLILAAQSLFYKKQYWQALDETNRALELVPHNAQAHALKGSIYYKMGLSKEAKAAWESALEIDPDMTQVKASLARMK